MDPQGANVHVGFVGVPPGTTTIRLGDGRVVQLGDFIDDKLFGIAEFTTGDTDQQDVFVNGRGAQVPGGTRNATKLDNNLQRPGGVGLPNAWEMFVYAIGIEITRVIRTGTIAISTYSELPRQAVAFDFARKAYFEYQYNGKSYTEGVLTEYPQGVGLYWQGTGNDAEITSNGVPSPRDRVAMSIPLHEEQGLAFKAVFTPVTALTLSQTPRDSGTTLDSLDVKVRKFGIIRRNVN